MKYTITDVEGRKLPFVVLIDGSSPIVTDQQLVETTYEQVDLGLSEKLSRVFYDAPNQELCVEYQPDKQGNKGVYFFYEVPQAVIDALLDVYSKGESVGSAMYRLVEPDRKTKEVKYAGTKVR